MHLSDIEIIEQVTTFPEEMVIDDSSQQVATYM